MASALKNKFKTFDQIKEKAAKSSGGFDGESPFLTLKDGDKYKVRFLQEFVEDSPDYDERRGTILIVDEHVSPKDFKIRAACTADESGRCWACEQQTLPEVGKKWKPKTRFYANVLVRGTDGNEDKVKIVAQGFSDKNIGPTLINIMEEFETLGAMDMSFSRKGSTMNDTSYSLIPVAPKPLTEAEQELELIDVSKFIKVVPYDEQPAFYSGQAEEGGKASDWTN